MSVCKESWANDLWKSCCSMKIRLKLNAAVHQWDVHLKKSVAQLVPKEGCQAIQLTSHLAADATKLQARFRSLGRYQPCTDLTAAERMAIVVVWMRNGGAAGLHPAAKARTLHEDTCGRKTVMARFRQM